MAKCKRHPKVETNLFCGKCGDPICPKCMVQTPVGARCPSCARLSRVPTYSVSKSYYLRAIGAGLGAAIVCGFVWGLLRSTVPFASFFNWIIAGAVGYGIGEAISLSVNRKSGTGLAAIGGIAVVLSYILSIGIFGWHYNLYDIIAIIIGIFVSVARLR